LLVVGHKKWVPDGELPEFEEDAYKNPPHKDLRAVIKIIVRPLDEEDARWSGNIVPEIPFEND